MGLIDDQQAVLLQQDSFFEVRDRRGRQRTVRPAPAAQKKRASEAPRVRSDDVLTFCS